MMSAQVNNDILHELKKLTLDLTVQENKVREISQRFEAAFNYSAIGMAIVSIDGQILDCNRSLSKMLGYSREEIKFRKLVDITHEEDVDICWLCINKLLRNESEYSTQTKRLVKRNGSALWVNVTVSAVYHRNGKVDYFIYQAIDITSEIEYRDNVISDSFVFNLVNLCPTPVIITKSNIIIGFNDSLSKILDRNLDDILHKSIFRFAKLNDDDTLDILIEGKYQFSYKTFDYNTVKVYYLNNIIEKNNT